MPLTALALLAGSAVLHTSWNLLLKQSGEKYIASWWTAVIGGVLFAPFLFVTGLPSAGVWGILLASALVEGLYYAALSFAYQKSDFSLVYPVARGSAPAFLWGWSVFILHEPLSPTGMVGIGLIVTGLLLIGWNSLGSVSRLKDNLRGLLAALMVALLISTYTALDGIAVKQTDPVAYALALFTLIPLLISPLTLWRYGWPRLKAEGLQHWQRLAGIAVLGVLAYGLVLVAYSLAPVGYAGSIREISVVFGALAGWKLLGEPLGSWRVAGSVLMFGGILLIALAG